MAISGTFRILIVKGFAACVKMEEYAKNEQENIMMGYFEGGLRSNKTET
jgi:hypothetical protein